MTAAEVTSIAINKHSHVQGTAEVSYWNCFPLVKIFTQMFFLNVNMQKCLPSIIIIASVPGFPRSVHILITCRRQRFERRGRPGLKYHMR